MENLLYFRVIPMFLRRLCFDDITKWKIIYESKEDIHEIFKNLVYLFIKELSVCLMTRDLEHNRILNFGCTLSGLYLWKVSFVAVNV
jgi:hypothetical protein